MGTWDTTFPAALSELHRLEFDYADGEGIDFEPYREFLTSNDTSSWFRAWTGNGAASGSEFRVFGQDGTGGYAAIWLALPETSILNQPIVFLGSEGQMGVVAADFEDYLWLLAGGFGPLEAVLFQGLHRATNPAFTQFARNHSTRREVSPMDVVKKAQEAFPGFRAWVESQCQ